MEYCEKHAHCNAEELKDWDADFVKVDQAMAQDLLVAGYDLNIEGLQLLVCQAIADMMAGKTPEEIRKIVNFKISMEARMGGAAQKNIYLDPK
jgi:S-phase kinase-associated protein 1